jgi:hypothetical protein
MLKHPSGEFGVRGVAHNSLCSSSSLSAWPSLESATGSSVSTTGSASLGGACVSNWLALTAQEHEVSRTKRYQAAPSPWIPTGTTSNTLTTMKNACIVSGDHLNGHDLDIEQIDGEDLEAMPAPLFRESFFSAIDESLKLIESSK